MSPASKHLRSEVWITAQLANTVLGEKTTVDWSAMAGDYDLIREKIERTIPGFDDYNRRVRVGGGFYLPNKPREGVYPTANNKANFTTHELPIHKFKNDEFVMMTVRTHDQFNTTIYGLEDRYRGIHNERRVIMLNPQDITEFDWKAGQVVDLTSHFEDGERHAKHFIIVPYDIPRRQAATYFPETNVLVPIGSVADRSHTPVSKFVIITISPTTETAGKFDYEYVDGHTRAAQMQTAQKTAKAGVFCRVNLQSIVGAATVALIVGGTIQALCGKR